MMRAVIPHVDDLGGSHGANQAFLELVRAGRVTCGSVIVPGPWFREIADAACADPSLDVGVHLTLTSEWEKCRWAPISTVSRASGLIDDDGYFWRDVEGVRDHLVPEAAEAELRAQIERAFSSGLRPTHVDAHMAAAMLPELLEAHVRLGREYGLFPVLPRSITWPPDLPAYQAVVDRLDIQGEKVIDHCRGTLPVQPGELAQRWAEVLHDLPEGLTHLALHCTAPGDFSALSSQHAPWRYAEYELFASGTFERLLAAEGIAAVGLRALQTLFIAGTAHMRPSAAT
ncbi:MAG: polysaccharide deacetylase family protein [Janthinobacterium lividum]